MNSNALRFIAFFFVILLIAISTVNIKNNIDLKELNATNIKIYYNKQIEFENERTYQSGVGLYITPTIETANNLLLENNFDGIEFTTSSTLKEILQILNANIVKTQKIMIDNSEKTIIYACTNKFNKFVTIENKKVNIQILLSSSENKVGLPLLLGSY